MKHAELGDFAAHAIDLDPIPETYAIASHENQPAEEGHDEIFQSYRETGADDADHGAELAGHADDDEQDDQNTDYAQCSTSDAAQCFHLSTIQLGIVEQALQPLIEKQQRQRNDHDDQG